MSMSMSAVPVPVPLPRVGPCYGDAQQQNRGGLCNWTHYPANNQVQCVHCSYVLPAEFYDMYMQNLKACKSQSWATSVSADGQDEYDPKHPTLNFDTDSAHVLPVSIPASPYPGSIAAAAVRCPIVEAGPASTAKSARSPTSSSASASASTSAAALSPTARTDRRRASAPYVVPSPAPRAVSSSSGARGKRRATAPTYAGQGRLLLGGQAPVYVPMQPQPQPPQSAGYAVDANYRPRTQQRSELPRKVPRQPGAYVGGQAHSRAHTPLASQFQHTVATPTQHGHDQYAHAHVHAHAHAHEWRNAWPGGLPDATGRVVMMQDTARMRRARERRERLGTSGRASGEEVELMDTGY